MPMQNQMPTPNAMKQMQLSMPNAHTATPTPNARASSNANCKSESNCQCQMPTAKANPTANVKNQILGIYVVWMSSHLLFRSPCSIPTHNCMHRTSNRFEKSFGVATTAQPPPRHLVATLQAQPTPMPMPMPPPPPATATNNGVKTEPCSWSRRTRCLPRRCEGISRA